MLTGVQFPVILSVIFLPDFELDVYGSGSRRCVHDSAGILPLSLFDSLAFCYLDH